MVVKVALLRAKMGGAMEYASTHNQSFWRELSQPTFDIGNTTLRAFEGVMAGVMAIIVIAIVAVL